MPPAHWGDLVAETVALRAQGLGFKGDRDIDEVIRAFIDEELGDPLSSEG